MRAHRPQPVVSTALSKAGPIRDAKHLAWVRERPCCICQRPAPSEACHIRELTDGGAGLKPSDNMTVPMCGEHHREQHTIGHKAFDARHGVHLRRWASMLWAEHEAKRALAR